MYSIDSSESTRSSDMTTVKAIYIATHGGVKLVDLPCESVDRTTIYRSEHAECGQPSRGTYPRLVFYRHWFQMGNDVYELERTECRPMKCLLSREAVGLLQVHRSAPVHFNFGVGEEGPL